MLTNAEHWEILPFFLRFSFQNLKIGQKENKVTDLPQFQGLSTCSQPLLSQKCHLFLLPAGIRHLRGVVCRVAAIFSLATTTNPTPFLVAALCAQGTLLTQDSKYIFKLHFLHIQCCQNKVFSFGTNTVLDEK